MRIFIFLSFLFFFSSCNHLNSYLIRKNNINISHINTQNTIPNISHFDLPTSVSYKKMNEKYQSSYGEIPLEDHRKVDKWIKYFTGRGRGVMGTYLKRSSRYLPIMKSVMREAQLPEDLVYIALIESGFSPKAHSRSNAVGYWQFIYGTGKRYGLRIDGFVDERRDPVLSTRAAVEYFKDLYSLFGSWHLALSAYNAGEYRVNRSVLKHYNRNFWYLVSKRALPKETRNYVPKFIAAVRIAKNPEKYGFYKISYQEPLNYDVLSVSRSISLKKLSGLLDIPYKELKNLNPMYKGEYIPIYNKKAILRLPVGVSVSKSLVAQSYMAQPKNGYYHHYVYRVRRGDTLYGIARKNRITVSSLRRYNSLGRRSLIRIGQKLKVPSKNLVSSRRSIASTTKNKKFHIVKKGDNLNHIAKKYKLTVTQLRSLNNLKKSSVIHPNQKLKIKKDNTSSRNLVSVSSKPHHTVTRGETLISIANKYKIGLPELMRANSMTFKSVLLTGTRLIIPK